jgi:hypothetical protein
METGDAEIASIWKPINKTMRKRHEKFLDTLEQDYKYDKWDLLMSKELYRDAIRKLPALVVDCIREEYPLSAEQLKILEEHRVEKKLFQFDYDTI